MANQTRGWPEARRRKQAENCRERRPWQQSTGPRTAPGKAASSANSLQDGFYDADMQLLRRLLVRHKRYLKTLMAGLSGPNAR